MLPRARESSDHAGPLVANAVVAATGRQDGVNDDGESFRDKMLRVMDDGTSQATEEEKLKFWESVRTHKELDALIAELNTIIESDSEDIDSRLVLAQAYIAKVLGSATGGPEQGLWAGKAESMWKEVLEVDASNWNAQHNIAFSYSQYPDFTNKTDGAIREYEKTVVLQDGSAKPGPGFSKTYLALSKLHLKNGDPGNALATLEKGVAAHPESNSLAE